MLNNKEFEFLKIRVEKIDNKVRGIDRGGCGLFAVELAIRLKKIKVPCKLYIIDNWGILESYDEDIQCHGSVDAFASKPTHVMVKVGRKYVDSNGVFTKAQVNKEFEYHNFMEIKPEQFIDAAKTEYGWNTWFDRSKQSLTIIKRGLTNACNGLNKLRTQQKKRKPVTKKRK